MKKTVLIILIALVFLFSYAFADEVYLKNLQIQVEGNVLIYPARISPDEKAYLINVESESSYIKLSPIASDNNAKIYVNGYPYYEDTNEIHLGSSPEILKISFEGSENVYTLFIQKTEGKKRNTISAGKIRRITMLDDVCNVSVDIVSLFYTQSSNLSTFENSSDYVYNDYPCAENCIFYSGNIFNPVRHINAQDFVAAHSEKPDAMYYFIYLNDEIRAILPYWPDIIID